MDKICVLGLGYIGLPTASVLAVNGFNVVGVDTNSSLVEIVNRGEIHIEEPGLATVVQAAINSGNLKASITPEYADVFIVAVPTPFKEDKQPDMSYVEAATKSIIPYLKKGSLVILESTSPPRTTDKFMASIIENGGFKVGKDIFLAHCPERVLPGQILKELIENDRVIGGVNRESAEKAGQLYSKFVSGKIFLTDASTAEMVKLVENTYRDVNIALANELSSICEKLGISIWEVRDLANKHPRVNVLMPGPGVGGHCISVDPWFIVSEYPEEAKLIKMARQTNDEKPVQVVKNIMRLIEGMDNPKIAIFGASYKADIDDTRESPTLKILDCLVCFKEKRQLVFSVYDPHVKHFEYEISTFENALKDANIMVIVTDHSEFKSIDPQRVGYLMKDRIVFDTRNCLNRYDWQGCGFKVYSLGDRREQGFCL